MLGKISGYVLAAVVALAPLPFGSVDSTWIAIWCLLLSVSLATADLRNVRPAHVWLLVPAFVVMLTLIVVVYLQTLPNPAFLSVNPIWEQVGRILDIQLDHRVAIDAALPWLALGPPALLFLAFS